MENPRLFVSYSWSSPEHEQWVLRLATELRESGIDVVLDKWDLREGQDADAFMERMVADDAIEKVILICDRAYAEKADKRKGGVGTEAQIISRKIYEQTDQSKFVAIVVEKDGDDKPFLPAYYQSRIYIDLSDNNLYAKNFEQLVRWVFDKPIYEKPELGSPPAFLNDELAISLGTTTLHRRAINAVRNGEEFLQGALDEYFNIFSSNLEKFRMQRGEREIDDIVVENVKAFLPYRNEMVELFSVLAQYTQNEATYKKVHKFFENLVPYLDKPEHITEWSTWDADNYKFIVNELFLYIIATLLNQECFSGVSYLLNHRYFTKEFYNGRNEMRRFTIFSNQVESLEGRNRRLELRRLSLHADILKERSDVSGISFLDVIQADFFLFLRDSLDRQKIKDDWSLWWPNTLLYTGYRTNPFEIFVRAQEKDYFEKIKQPLGIKSKDEIDQLVEAFNGGKIRVPTWGGLNRIFPVNLMNYELLASS